MCASANSFGKKVTGKEFLTLMGQHGLDLRFRDEAKLPDITNRLRNFAASNPSATVTIDFPDCKRETVNQYVSKLKLKGALAKHGVKPIVIKCGAKTYGIQFEVVHDEADNSENLTTLSFYFGINQSLEIPRQFAVQLEQEFLRLATDSFGRESVNLVPNEFLDHFFLEFKFTEEEDLIECVDVVLRDALIICRDLKTYSVNLGIDSSAANSVCVGVDLTHEVFEKNRAKSLRTSKATRLAKSLFKKSCSKQASGLRRGLPAILCSKQVVALTRTQFDFHPGTIKQRTSNFLDNVSDYVPDRARFESDVLRSTLEDLFHNQNVIALRLSSGEEIDLVSYQAKAFARKTDPKRLVLECDFHESRKHDLLGGIIQAVARVMNLEQANNPKYGGLRGYVENWCQKNLDCLRSEHCSNVAETLSTLLVGTTDDSEFYRWAKVNIKQILFALAKTQPILLIVRDGMFMDELSKVMVDCLIDRSSDNDNIQLLILCSKRDLSREFKRCSPKTKSIKISVPNLNLTEELSQGLADETLLVGQIANVLGWGFPRYWLRDLFFDLSPHPNLDDFDEAVGQLVSNGVLKFDGHNYDLRNSNKRCRRMTFGSFAAYELVKPEPGMRTEILLCFLKCLGGKLAELKTERNLTHKNLICEYLVECQDQAIVEELGPLRVAKLWHFVAKQAYISNANEEARYRSVNALYTLFPFVQADQLSGEDIAANFEICTLFLNVMARCNQLCDETPQLQCQCNSVNDTIEAVLSLFNSIDEQASEFIIDKLGVEKWFALGRALWSWHQRWGNLNDAISLALRLNEFVSRLTGDETRLDLLLESYHLLVVSHFTQGNFDDCVEAAKNAEDIFGKTDKLPLREDCEIHGSHNGYACCLLLRAYSEILRPNGEVGLVAQLLSRVVGSTFDLKQHCGDNTKFIASGYIRMIFAQVSGLSPENSERIKDSCLNRSNFQLTEIKDKSVAQGNRWANFCLLSQLALKIRMKWQRWLEGDAPSDDLHELSSQFDEHVRLWRADDMSTYWMLSQAKLLAMEESYGAAINLLDQAIQIADNRNEKFCIKDLVASREKIEMRAGEIVFDSELTIASKQDELSKR